MGTKKFDMINIALFFVLFIMLVYLQELSQMSRFSLYFAIAETILVSLSILYAYLYYTYDGKHKKCILLSLAISAAVVFSSALIALYYLGFKLFAFVSLSGGYLLFFMVLLPPFIFITLGFFIYKKGQFGPSSKYLAIMFIAVAVFCIWLIFFSGGVLNSFIPNDEEWLGLNSLSLTFSGQNPYSASLAAEALSTFLKGNNSINSFTITTRNNLIATQIHPSLYFLSMLPLYLMAPFNQYDISHVYLPFGTGAFILILFLLFAYLSDAKSMSKPNFAAIIFITFAFILSTSIVSYLMLAVMLIAYAKMDSKYLFVFLGLAVSMQQLLWVPALIFLVYRFNDKGAKSGLLTLLGIAAVFLAINGYFIALSPNAFFGSIFSTLNNNLFPNAASASGNLLLQIYPVPLNSLNVLFYCATAISLLAIAYHNDKRLLGLLMLFPFMFLYSTLILYITFFVCFLVLTTFIAQKHKKTGKTLLQKLTRGKQKEFTILAILFIIGICAFYIYVQHNAYMNEFNINVHDGTLTTSNGNSIYSASLTYNLANKTELYFVAYTFMRNVTINSYLYGLTSNAILQNSDLHAIYNLTNYSSLINDNRFTLQGNGTRNFTIVISNSSVTDLSCNIYTGSFYYLCPTTARKT